MEKKKERRRRKNNKMKIFTFDFLDSEEKQLNSGAIFYIRIAKGFLLYEFCISSLCLS